MIRRHVLSFLFFCLTSGGAAAQQISQGTDSLSRVFELGEVQIVADEIKTFTLKLGREELANSPQEEVARVLENLPGISFVHMGQKNEAMVHVRGFDLRQVPLLLDGVPVYVSYDGYADLARFLNSDLSAIQVTRGESSLLLGPNAMGGVINLLSRKPEDILEMDLSLSVLMDKEGYGGRSSSLHLGSRKKKYYFQAGLACVNNRAQILPGGKRQFNSQRQDLNTSFKWGFTPRAGDSYVLGFHYLRAQKGVTPYSGEDPFQRKRYWKFPNIAKTGFHFNSRTAIGRKGYVQSRFFYDRYQSELQAWDDSSFTSRDLGSSFTSIYQDQSLGSNVLLAYRHGADKELKLALNLLYDYHREENTYPEAETPRHFRDLSWSMAMEDEIRLGEHFIVRVGIAGHLKTNIRADNYDPRSDSIYAFPEHRDRSLNLLSGLHYRLREKQELQLNLSRKTRFPTMKDRYSYRLGRSLPNPELRSESVWNMDLSYAYVPSSLLNFRTSAFHSLLQQTIQAVYGIDPDDSGIYQFRNTGRSRFYGWEAELNWTPSDYFKGGLNYTLTERKNLSHPEFYFINLPRHQAHIYADRTLFSRWTVGLSIAAYSGRFSSTDGVYRTSGFMNLDFRTSIRIFSGFKAAMSISNALNSIYSYSEGYLAPGRQVRASLRYSFQLESCECPQKSFNL